MSENKVTIVIPTFNRAHYVSKTIESALAQTVPCEIIVCDHGSTDNTKEVVEKFGDKITYIRREKDFGPHFCWLEGILNASNEFIHIHFDDDLLEPTFVEKTLELMKDDVGMVFSEAKVVNAASGEICCNALFNFKSGISKSSYLEHYLLRTMMISPAACLYRKSVILDCIMPANLPFDFGEKYHGVGVDLLMSLVSCNRYPYCGFVPEALSIFGSHEGSITVNANTDLQKAKKLSNAYDSYRAYYRLMKYYKTHKLCALYFNNVFRFSVLYKKVLELLGLRRKDK